MPKTSVLSSLAAHSVSQIARRFASCRATSYTSAEHSSGRHRSSCFLARLTNEGFREALRETYHLAAEKVDRYASEGSSILCGNGSFILIFQGLGKEELKRHSKILCDNTKGTFSVIAALSFAPWFHRYHKACYSLSRSL